MSVTYEQIPAEVSISCVQGDELNIGLNCHQTLVGYTLSAIVYAEVSSNGGDAIGSTAAAFSVGAISLAAGTVTLGLTETQTAALVAGTRYRWYFRWQDAAGFTQTILAGPFVVRVP
jgi:hypothetical protein